MSPGTILIRADASPEIGMGHVMRCLALAQAWQDAGGEAVFVMAKSVPAVSARLKCEGAKVVSIDCEPGDRGDVKQTIEAARASAAEWIVLDGYQFDEGHQEQITQAGQKLIFLDDKAHCRHYSADLVLNQNIHACEAMYSNRDRHTRLLLGNRFVLLRREFSRWAKNERTIRVSANQILVAFGGSDPSNATTKVLHALAEIAPESLEVTVVIGAGNPRADAVMQNCAAHQHSTRIARNPESMAVLMAEADLAISAGGAACWEMCFLGLPAIVFAVAENQKAAAEELGRRRIIEYLGPIESFSAEKLADRMRQLLRSKQRRAAMSRAGRELIDGRGRERVLAAMLSTVLNPDLVQSR